MTENYIYLFIYLFIITLCYLFIITLCYKEIVIDNIIIFFLIIFPVW